MKKPTKKGITEKIKYDPSTIEPKWQSEWKKRRAYQPDLDSANRPFYNLMMFPYPSAEGLHIGGMRTFGGVDIYGRFKRMRGHDTFQPFGLDGFGIHAENYALKIGAHPMEHAEVTEKNFYRQIREAGLSVDWSRIVETYKPEYYKWTQWLFAELFKAGLAYRKKSPVNFCPGCKTVLADEQVVDGKCERCSSIVEKRNLEQWFFRITKYADRLLENIDGLNWTEKVKIAQRNWIGKSEGARVKFQISNFKFQISNEIEVFTTRPDTLFGATFLVASPEHPLTEEIVSGRVDVPTKTRQEVTQYVEQAKGKSELDRIAEGREKTGVFSGIYAVNPVNNEEIPVWIADYVLIGYGTGAIMAVPAHDQRDLEFANKYHLSVKQVIAGKTAKTTAVLKEAFTGGGVIVNSKEWDGWNTPGSMGKVIDWLERKGIGKRETTYHLRDWLISRQRYWGPPIPMIFCEKCAERGDSWFTTGKGDRGSRGDKGDGDWNSAGWYPEEKLPVTLPKIDDYRPLGTGQSPLGSHPEFFQTTCPGCGSKARRETDISDNFLDSAWYFLRYLATDFKHIPFPSKKFQISNFKYQISNNLEIKNLELEIRNSAQRAGWLPVHMYIGGAEHSVLHLLYARFITMVLKDLDYIEFEEPFARFYAHGLIIKDGAKMSKSKGNVVSPDVYIKKYGADTLRTYLHFLAPFNQEGDFRDSGIEGMSRFLKRVWKLFAEPRETKMQNNAKGAAEPRRMREMHKTIKKVTEEFEHLRFNTAIAALMEWYNFLSKEEFVLKEEAEVYFKLLAPLAPHLTEELWEQLGNKTSIHEESWPSFDHKFLLEERITIPVTVNGKLRATLEVDREDAEDQKKIEDMARSHEAVVRSLEGKSVKKFIYVPGKVVNFVAI